MNKVNDVQPQNIAFKGMTKNGMRIWREINGCPTIVNASYDGYTGAKMHKFPTRNNLRSISYPDVTEEYEKFQKELYKIVEKLKKQPFGRIKLLKEFLKNFATGEAWDTKFLPEFPGRDVNGIVQYAKYNGKVVKGNFLSNYIYGYLCAALGISEKQSKNIAKIYSCGLIEPLINGKIPNNNVLKFRDPADDQEAISLGFKEFKELLQKSS